MPPAGAVVGDGVIGSCVVGGNDPAGGFVGGLQNMFEVQFTFLSMGGRSCLSLIANAVSSGSIPHNIRMKWTKLLNHFGYIFSLHMPNMAKKLNRKSDPPNMKFRIFWIFQGIKQAN